MTEHKSNDTYGKVATIVADVLSMKQDEITKDSTFEALGADSLDRLEIIMKFEETFGVTISDQQEANIATIQEAVTAIQELRGK